MIFVVFVVYILNMNSTQFNEACRHLRRDSLVRIRLVTGDAVEGSPLQHIPAGSHDGSIELDTSRGLVSLLSSSIEQIESITGTDEC